MNGTSFGAPNQTAMLSWAAQAAKRSGVELTNEECQGLLERSAIQSTDREAREGGMFFNLPKFLTELNGVISKKVEACGSSAAVPLNGA